MLDVFYVCLVTWLDGDGRTGKIVSLPFLLPFRDSDRPDNAFLVSFATAIVNVAGCRLVLSLKINARHLQIVRARTAFTMGQSRYVVVWLPRPVPFGSE